MSVAELASPLAAPVHQPVAVFTDVRKRYDDNVVLDGVSASVRPGVTGLLGANGAGKTTLIGLLLGLHRPESGAISVLGREPIVSFGDPSLPIGYAPEHHSLPADVPAVDFVEHLAVVHGLPRADASGRASDAMWYVGLGEERGRPMGTMSTGQRQRVKLAMAIAHDPDLVILDEPTDGLDPTQRENMLDLIRRIAGEFGISVLLSSHLLDEVERTCDDVVILANGKVAASGPIAELRGEGRGVSFELDVDPSSVVTELAARGLSVERDGVRVTVRSEAAVDQRALLVLVRDLVAEQGVGIRRLAPRTVSLEEFYLQVGQ